MSNSLSNEKLKEYSKNIKEVPFLESSLIKIPPDLEKMELSSFEEKEEFPEGFEKLSEVASASHTLENIKRFGNEFLEPHSGFGHFVLSNLKKPLFIECRESEKIGYLKLKSGKGLTLEPLFIEVPENTNCSLLINCDLSEGEVTFDLIRVKIGARGKLSLYILFENFKGKRFVDFSVSLDKESSCNFYPVFLGGEASLFRSVHKIYEEKCSYKEGLIILLKNKEKGDFRTDISERGRGIKVNVEARGVVKDFSRAYISGLLKVKSEASKSSSLYSAHCLKLSQNSRVDVQPNLEIEALDVVASHSASVSPVDAEKLFYLESRGLDEEEAKKEVSSGFLFSLIERNNFIKEKIEEIL